MTVFALVNISDPVKIEAALNQHFAENFLKVSSSVFFVAGRGVTAQNISDKLGITDGTNGIGIVITSAGYFGRAAQNIWEWINVKVAQP